MGVKVDNFEKYIDGVIGREGGFSCDPNDKGNWYLGKLEGTMWGITAAEARAHEYVGLMNQMSRDTALAIYRTKYWLTPKFDQIDAIDATLAAKLLDIGVNMGPPTGVQFMQRALNVLNQQGKVFPDIMVDGGIGPMTLAALKAFYAQRGADGHRVLVGMVASMHSVRYVEIAEKNPSQQTFEYGWQLNRALGAIA
ncbi:MULTISPECIES: glycoside hydrolase family 108 protein [unclassified Paraburkholderia]|uniref:glycoside hydrolase family 108 protein n=1 Tax=unclassified Paraburkholderia TaxID=2615204 RepID=UPI001620C603|nr:MULTISPECIES: glycosyl hydrolase 108 family protein [unclassified Paraburkholderia]